MKKFGIILLIAAAVLTMGSCGNKTTAVPFDNGDSVNQSVDSTLYGICGEATSMNMLQIIVDTGDTLMLDISYARDRDKVFGGLQVGDRIAVYANDNNSEAIIVINQNALLGDWVMPNPIDGSSEVGIRIKEGGVAESIDQSSIIYKTWKLFNGRLEILSQRDGGGDEEELNLYEIVKLGADSLVYRTLNKPREEMETFEYSRWKEPEQMDLHGLQLEDAADEFHL